jgi:hypothetical protein
MNKLLLVALIGCCLLISSVEGHDLFESHPNLQANSNKQNIFDWILDHIKLVLWVISAIPVVPLGIVLSLLGMPNAYSGMQEYVISKLFKLSAYNTTASV